MISFATQLSYNINTLFVKILTEYKIDCKNVLSKKLGIDMKTWLRELFLVLENMHKVEKKVDSKVSHNMAFKPVLLTLLSSLEKE